MRHAFTDGVVLFKVFRCAIAKGRPRPLDARALRWVTPEQLTRYRFPPANRRLIERLTECGAPRALPVGRNPERSTNVLGAESKGRRRRVRGIIK